ncbi:MAG: hypothetical protein ACK4Q5_13120 [Saprospiraceae bacterium]
MKSTANQPNEASTEKAAATTPERRPASALPSVLGDSPFLVLLAVSFWASAQSDFLFLKELASAGSVVCMALALKTGGAAAE